MPKIDRELSSTRIFTEGKNRLFENGKESA
jgi:hypothetical protein